VYTNVRVICVISEDVYTGTRIYMTYIFHSFYFIQLTNSVLNHLHYISKQVKVVSYIFFTKFLILLIMNVTT